jgi:hypothetical protein
MSDIATAINANADSTGAVTEQFGVGMLRKAQDMERMRGAEAVRLIDLSTPQMTKTADGHISVRA